MDHTLQSLINQNIPPSLLNNILENAPLGIFLVDREGRILLCNPSALKMFGYSPEELQGQTIELLVPELKRKKHETHRNQYIQNPHSRPMGMGMNLIARRKDDSEFPVEISLSFINEGPDLMITAFVVDISARRQAEEEVAQLRDTMIHTLIHDLRNPLGSIFTSLQLLEDEVSLLRQSEDKKIVDIALHSTQRALELVNNLLDINRLENDQLPINSTEFPLRPLIDEVLELELPLAQNKEIHLKSDLATNLPPAVADAGLIRRVLQNLIGNAIKFTPVGGVILVSAELIPLAPQARLRISIQDSGPGIPPEMEGRLFQKFATGKQKGRGTGLGLAFCKLALDAHNEQIWAENPPGQGATISFTLKPAA